MTEYCQLCGKNIEPDITGSKRATVEVYPFVREWQLCQACARGLVDAIREYMKETKTMTDDQKDEYRDTEVELRDERDSSRAKLKQGEVSPERKCWTCRHYAPSFVSCTRLYFGEVLICVNNDWRWWEAER